MFCELRAFQLPSHLITAVILDFTRWNRLVFFGVKKWNQSSPRTETCGQLKRRPSGPFVAPFTPASRPREGLEQEFNSLDAQRECAEAYILSQRDKGWIALTERYDDGGFTGANVDRPGLRQLLADVEARRVDCVVVYKVDRLSRSLPDFTRLMEVFDKRGTTFVSRTER